MHFNIVIISYLLLPQGFTFLNIPRSYYGVLTKDLLMNGINDELSEGNSVSKECANAVFGICVSEGLVGEDCSLDLDVTKDKVKEVLDSNIPPTYSQEYQKNKCFVLDIIMLSRYVNLFYLLRVSCIDDIHCIITCLIQLCK